MKTKYSSPSTMLVLAACLKNENGNDNGPGLDTTNINTGSPVETNRPNTNYSPAFAGQGRRAKSAIMVSNPESVYSLFVKIGRPLYGLVPIKHNENFSIKGEKKQH